METSKTEKQREKEEKKKIKQYPRTMGQKTKV
jgi:hypothetical protein